MTKHEQDFLKLLENNEGFYSANDTELAELLNVTVYSLAKYKKRLIKDGYIDTRLKHVNGKLRCFYKLLKPYNAEDEVKLVW